jgi:Flp pilus assembly pilin Flp
LVTDDGVTSTEYALIAGLVAVAIVLSVTSLGDALGILYDSVGNAFR